MPRSKLLERGILLFNCVVDEIDQEICGVNGLTLRLGARHCANLSSFVFASLHLRDLELESIALFNQRYVLRTSVFS